MHAFLAAFLVWFSSLTATHQVVPSHVHATGHHERPFCNGVEPLCL
jgi:hypothetical protein